MELAPEYIGMIETLLEEVRALRSEVRDLRMDRPDPSRPLPTWDIKACYTYDECAEIWDVSRRTVEGWVSSRKVLTIQRGGPRVPHDEVMRVWERGVRKR